MPDVSDEGPDHAERAAANAAVAKDAWKRTIDDMQAMAAEFEEAGWETIAVAAGDTAPNPPGVGDPDRFGLVHVIPGNYADAFSEAFAAGEFPRYDVFRETIGGQVYSVIQLLDPDSKTAIFLAGAYETRLAGELARAVRKHDRMYTHVQKLDGTRLGSFEHDDYTKFFPDEVLARVDET